jgi:hypothetical protein
MIAPTTPAMEAASRKHRLLRRLENDFTYHPPKGDQVERYGAIRTAAGELARLIAEKTPESREQSVALTKLDEVVFWANASIARNE